MRGSQGALVFENWLIGGRDMTQTRSQFWTMILPLFSTLKIRNQIQFKIGTLFGLYLGLQLANLGK